MNPQLQPSVTHSHLAGRGYKALALSRVEGFEKLRNIGIALDSRDVEKMMDGMRREGIALDTIQQGLTTPSITTPIQFLQAWLPGFVTIITAARKIDNLVGVSTVGSWMDAQVVQGLLELTGSAVPYGDLSNVPLANWNTNFETRDIIRFEQGMRVGKLEEQRAGAIRMDSAATKRTAAGQQLEISRNQVGFNGYNDGASRIYGFLNDPGLLPYVTVAVGAAGFTTWATKTFLEITADLRAAAAQLQIQSQDNINPEDVECTLALATANYQYLSVTSDFGISVRQWIRETYPKWRIESAPQLNGANGGANVFYLYAETVQDLSTDDRRTFIQMVPARFQLIGVSQQTKGYEEDYSNATAGVMAKRPYAIVRRSGT